MFPQPDPSARPALLVLATLWLGFGCAADDRPPNVLLISLDTLRADHVGAYGYPAATTPNIDALAERGTLFVRAYAHAPNTAASHTSIFTSVYPTVHGVRKHGQVADRSLPTLADELRAAGYATAAFTQLTSETYDYGFERRHFLPSPRPEHIGIGDIGPALAWVEEQRDRPFFLFLHTYEVHLPYAARPELLAKRLPDHRGPLPPVVTREVIDELNGREEPVSEEELAYLLAQYDAQLEHADAVLGELFGRLEELGLERRTIVALLSDHGEEFGDHGLVGRHSHTLYNELLHVPMILAGPGVPAGRRVEVPVRTLDLAPTLLRLAGLEPPAGFMGRELAPVWRGEERRPRPVLAESRRRWAVIDGGYKLFSDGRLFELEEDPGELRDVAARAPEAAARLRELRTRLEAENARRRAAVDKPPPARMTREELERLRALGYLQ